MFSDWFQSIKALPVPKTLQWINEKNYFADCIGESGYSRSNEMRFERLLILDKDLVMNFIIVLLAALTAKVHHEYSIKF